MKKLLLSILFVGVATLANAQKSEVSEAKKAWDLFTVIGSNKQPIDKTLASLDKGLAHTDLAISNEKSKILPDAWSYRALFASAIAVTDTVNISNSIAKQKIAEEAIDKAKSLDVKNSEKDNIATAEINIVNAIRIRGKNAFDRKDFATAYDSFMQLSNKDPQDTTMYVNLGVTAKELKKYPEAIQHFKKAISLKYPDSKLLYYDVINMSLDNLKDSVAGLALTEEAVKNYPDDIDLLGIQTDLYLKKGDVEKSQALLGQLIAKNPNKPIYHYLMGDTYYKQALAIQIERSKIDAKKVKEFDAITAKMVALIDKALPFYEKAIQVDPVFVPALEVLKQVYGFKGDSTKFDDVKKRLDAIPAKN